MASISTIHDSTPARPIVSFEVISTELLKFPSSIYQPLLDRVAIGMHKQWDCFKIKNRPSAIKSVDVTIHISEAEVTAIPVDLLAK
jgi:hypothetical protein